MTYSLHTLNSSSQEVSPPASGAARFVNEIALVAGFVALLLWLISLLSYSPQDPAWSTSGSGMVMHNQVGRLGAWMADVSYFVLGFSVWWCVAAGWRIWLSLLASRLRGEGAGDAASSPTRHSAWVVLAGLFLLLCASTSLEWSRLYRLEAFLPGSSGGALGQLVGSAMVFGF